MNNMLPVLSDLAIFIKEHNVKFSSDDIGGITLFHDNDSQVYFPNGEIDLPTLIDIIEKTENPDRHHIEASDINQIDLTLNGNDIIDTPKLEYVWCPKGVSIDSGHLTFDVSRNGLFINIAIRKHGFTEIIVDFVKVPIGLVHNRKFRIFVKNDKIHTTISKDA